MGPLFNVFLLCWSNWSKEKKELNISAGLLCVWLKGGWNESHGSLTHQHSTYSAWLTLIQSFNAVTRLNHYDVSLIHMWAVFTKYRLDRKAEIFWGSESRIRNGVTNRANDDLHPKCSEAWQISKSVTMFVQTLRRRSKGMKFTGKPEIHTRNWSNYHQEKVKEIKILLKDWNNHV